MSFRLKLPVFALALAFATPLAAAAPIQDTPTQATKTFKGEINVRLAALKETLDALDAQFKADIDALREDVENGLITPADAHVAAFDLMHALDAAVAAALRVFTDGLELDASAHLAQLLLFVNAFVVGDDDLIDDARHRAAVLHDKARGRNHKRVRALIKHLEKEREYDIVVDRRHHELDPVTPSATDSEADTPFERLRIHLIVAGSDRTVASDGRLCLAGTADVNLGATVDVSIALPGGTPLVTLATEVDPVTRRWRVCFPESGAGDLPEGNYFVTVTQGGFSISDSVGVQ